ARADVWRELEVGQVQADERLRVVERHVGADTGAEVAAAGAVARVPETAHQSVPERGDIWVRDCTIRTLRQPITGQRRNHDVEGRAIDPVPGRAGPQRYQ